MLTTDIFKDLFLNGLHSSFYVLGGVLVNYYLTLYYETPHLIIYDSLLGTTHTFYNIVHR